MVLRYKTSPEIKNVVLCIGTNDAFQNQNIKDLFKIVKRTFPNATIYVIKGSWGWGNNKNITEEKVNSYYSSYNKEGAITLDPAIGNNNPHQNLPIYKTIGKKLDSILQ
jgi:hypothetical protein